MCAQRGEPLVELGPAAVEQHPVGHRGLGRRRGAADLLTAQPRGTRREQDVEFGDVHRADAQVGGRIQAAGVRQVTGRRQQPLHPRPTHRGGGGNLLRDDAHLVVVLEVALGVGAVQVARVQGDQPADRIQDVCDRGLRGRQVAGCIGQHGRSTHPGGERQHPGGERAGQGGSLPTGPTAMGHHLDAHLGAQRVAPAGQQVLGLVGTSAGQRPAHVGVRAQQRHQPLRVLTEHRQGHQRPAALPGQVRGGDHPAQRGPARGTAGKQHDTWMPRVHRHPTPGRRGRPVRPGQRDGPRPLLADGQVDAEDRADARLPTGQREGHGSVGTVAIGQCEGVLAHRRGPLHEGLRPGGPVPQRVARGHVQVDESGHRRSPRTRWAGSTAGRPRSPQRPAPGTTRRHARGHQPPAG